MILWKRDATIRAQLEKKGTPIGPYDLLIAGLALSQDMILVTNNTKEFQRISGLPLENWAEYRESLAVNRQSSENRGSHVKAALFSEPDGI